jgi:hypothetical protein
MRGDGMSVTLKKRMFWMAFGVRVAFMTLARKYEFPPLLDHFHFGFEMGRIARALATGYGYADPFGGHSGPTAWVPPLYPLIMAAVFKIFGIYTLKSAWVILTINSLFSAAVAPAVYEIGWRCFGKTDRGLSIATWSGWLWAFFPAAMQYAVHWVWEMSISTAILTWILVLALRIRGVEGERYPVKGDHSTKLWSLFGLLWGLLALSNSSLMVFLPFCGLWMVWDEVPRHFGRALRNAVLAAACCATVISPWIVRNWYAFHAFVPMRSNMGAELFEATRFWNEGFPTMATLPESDADRDVQEYRKLGEISYSRKKGAAAELLIHQHPRLFLLHAVKRFFLFWDGVPNPVYGFNSVVSEGLREFNYASISVGGILGLILALKRKIPGAWLFLWAYLSIPAIYYFISVQARFRHPLEPVMLVLIVYLFQSAEPRQNQSRLNSQ